MTTVRPDSSRPGCPEGEDWQRFLNDPLDGPERDRLDAHLDACRACRDRVGGLAGDWSLAFRAAAAASPPDGATAAWVERLRRGLGAGFGGLPDADGAEDGFPAIPGLSGGVAVGRGGMGIVFRARQEALDRDVAVKVLPGGALDGARRARARREARALARMRHPHIVPLHGAGEVDGRPFLVMEWVDGGTLQAVVDRGPTPYREALTLILPVARAIVEAHARGIVHRDLKPSNVLLACPPDGGPPVPKLADFGLALWGDEAGLTESGQVIGTPAYMAPEQAGLDPSLGAAGPATDIHGLGALLHALLTGRPPYRGDSTWATLSRVARGEVEPLRRSCPGLPRDVESVVARCLERLPGRRYPTATALVDDLRRVIDGRPVAARPVSLPVRLTKWARRRPAAATAAALLVVAALAGLVGGVYHVRTLRDNVDALRREQQRTAAALAASDAARRRAFEALRTLDEEVVGRFLGSEPELDRRGKTLLATVGSLYREIQPGTDDARPELDELRAEILFREGRTRQRLDAHDEAAALFGRAVEAFDRVLADPRALAARPSRERGRRACLFARFVSLSKAGRRDEAGRIAAALRDDPDLRRAPDRSGVVAVVGQQADNLAAEGRRAAAEEAYAEAHMLAEAFYAETPDDPALIPNFSTLLDHRVVNLVNQGRRSEASSVIDRLIALGEAGLDRGPGPDDWRHHAEALRLGLLHRINLAAPGGQPADPIPLVRRRLELDRRLIAAFPLEPGHRREQIRDAKALFALLGASGRPEQAEDELREAIESARQLTLMGTPSAADCFEYCKLIGDLGDLFLQSRRSERAVAEYERALEVVLPLAAPSGDRRYLDHANYLQQNIAALHHELSHAARASQRAAAVEPLVSRAPADAP